MDYTTYYSRPLLRGDMSYAREIRSMEMLRRQYWYDPAILENLNQHLFFLLNSSKLERPVAYR
jgi:hypothetical protein